MIVQKVRNVSEALKLGLSLALEIGVPRGTRNGTVLRIPEPVTTVYQRPDERVLVNGPRNANPFFHFFESLWMLAGRNDVEYVARYVKRMRQFSDDGTTLHGAYGWRWRGGLGADQIRVVVDLLRKDPSTRRAVIAMYDAMEDASELSRSRDIPCNTHIYFDVTESMHLNMTVCCRSNDIVWGAFGANAVHMSVLHEYVAACTGLPMGVYRQMSNDLHLYTHVVSREQAARIVAACDTEDVYSAPLPRMVPLRPAGTPREQFMDLFEHEVHRVIGTPVDQVMKDRELRPPFFRDVAAPMHDSWRQYRSGDMKEAMYEALRIQADDWRAACLQWLGNRCKKELV